VTVMVQTLTFPVSNPIQLREWWMQSYGDVTCRARTFHRLPHNDATGWTTLL
jgi:hypothetical protein